MPPCPPGRRSGHYRPVRPRHGAGRKVAGGFLTIANDGKKADKLVSVSAPGVKRVEIHEMTMQDQIMKMRKLEGGLDLPAGKTMQLKSGSYHLMFIEPEHPYEEGETVPVTLEFKKAGKVEINFPVTAKKARPRTIRSIPATKNRRVGGWLSRHENPMRVPV